MNANGRWERIQKAPLISPAEDELFIRKLVRQNGWSRSFAERAVQEYRRFVFLAVEAGRSVSPPDAVDQVWHLHLTYTHAYWKVFCLEVLGQPLHHWPSQGGMKDSAKFQDWYEQTLESYRQWFGKEPTDIWPDVERKIKDDRRAHRRVDLGRYWLIPKPLNILAWARVALLLIPLLVALGCSTLPIRPLHWNVDGPTFLGIYVGVLAAAVIVSVIARRALARGSVRSRSAEELKLYEMAFLAGGSRRVLQSMLVRLHEAGIVTLDDKGKVHAEEKLFRPVDPMETTVRDSLETGAKTWAQLRGEIAGALAETQQKLIDAGLLVPDAEAFRARMISTLLMGGAVLIGALRLWHAVDVNRPFGFLLVLLLGALVAMLALLRRPFRTAEGDAALERVRAVPTEDALRELESSGVFGAHSALAVSLFGVAVLSGTPLEKLQKQLGVDSSGASWAGCGSSCGGGGGSCGSGGGGCGGGCGGCGGG
jgi:uncharacterized protein (TIGR04222 family)